MSDKADQDSGGFGIDMNINLTVLPPLLSRQQFSAFTGTTPDTVRGWVQCATIPSVKIGRQRLINVTRLIEDLKLGKSQFNAGDYEEALR